MANRRRSSRHSKASRCRLLNCSRFFRLALRSRRRVRSHNIVITFNLQITKWSVAPIKSPLPHPSGWRTALGFASHSLLLQVCMPVRFNLATPKPIARGPLPRGSGGGRRVGYLAVLLAGRFVFLVCLVVTTKRLRSAAQGAWRFAAHLDFGTQHLRCCGGVRLGSCVTYNCGITSSVKDVNEPVLRFLTVSVIFSVHLPAVLVPS